MPRPKAAARCKPERHLELLHHGKSPSSHTHGRRSPDTHSSAKDLEISANRHCGHHRTKRISSRLPSPMAPLHLPANTDQAHLLYRCARATPPTNHRHYLTKMGLRCGASKEGTTPMVPPLHVQGWTGFTPSRAPCSRGHDASQWCPQQVERRHKGATTIATDIDVSEDLRPT